MCAVYTAIATPEPTRAEAPVLDPGARAPCGVSRTLLRACAISRSPPLHPFACAHAYLRSSSSVGVLLKLWLPLVSVWAQHHSGR